MFGITDLHNPYKIATQVWDSEGNEILSTPERCELEIYQSPDSEMISSHILDCKYNTGGHGDRCKASHPEVDKIGNGVGCPYSFDIS